MNATDWISIAALLITSGITIWSTMYRVRAKEKSLTNQPSQKTWYRISIILAVAVLNFVISVFNILTFVNEPELSNVGSLCVGVAVITFTLSLLISYVMFGMLINLFSDTLERFKKILSVMEKLNETDIDLKDIVIELENRLTKLKAKVKK